MQAKKKKKTKKPYSITFAKKTWFVIPCKTLFCVFLGNFDEISSDILNIWKERPASLAHSNEHSHSVEKK